MKAEKGVTLIEVMGALTVLAVAVAGTLTAVQMASTSNSVSRERTRALEAAQQMIAEIRATPFDLIVPTYDETSPGEPFTFPVDFYVEHRRLPADAPRPMGIEGKEEGEVVIIPDGTPTLKASGVGDYGRDLEPADGERDGIVLGDADDPDGPFPLDLNGLIPVYVIVRWRSLGRPASNRVQLCTFISDWNWQE